MSGKCSTSFALCFCFITALTVWTIPSCNAWRDTTFKVNHELKNKTIVGDAALTLYDVKHPVTCALRCSERFPCAFFFYNKADGVCVLHRSPFMSFLLTDASGYKFFTTEKLPPAQTSDNGTDLCPTGTVNPLGCWTQLASGRLSHTSVGPAGVWGTNLYTQNFHRIDTYGDPSSSGLKWTTAIGLLVQADVGSNTMFGVNGAVYDDVLFRRDGISASSPTGTDWLSLTLNRTWVSVSPTGSVWSVNKDNQLLYARDSASQVTTTTAWDVMASGMRQVDAGWAGVWALDDAGRLYYRRGTYGDKAGISGTEWVMLEGEFSFVSSGTNFVVAVTSAGRIWFRVGLSADAPTGLGWALYPGIMKQVEIYEDGKVAGLWAVDFNDIIYFSVIEK